MTVVIRTPDPIEIATPNQGVVRMKWLTLNSQVMLEELQGEALAPRESMLRILREHLLAPTPSLQEFTAWPAPDVDALARGWAMHPIGLNQPLDEKEEVAAAFRSAVTANLAASQARWGELFRGQLEVMDRQQKRLMTAGMQGIAESIQRITAVERSWQHSLFDRFAELNRTMRVQESLFQRQALMAASEDHARFLTDMTSAIAANAKLASLADMLSPITEGLRAAAEHTARLDVLAGLEGPSRAAAAALSQGLSSLSETARAVFVDWERLAIPPVGAWLREAPGVEIFSASRAAAVVVGTVQDDPPAAVERLEIAALRVEPLLSRVNPQLIQLYQGAAGAIVRAGPDATRHMATSLRELLTHVLHTLAPDEALQNWSGRQPGDFVNGRPTRAARIRYILRRLLGTSYAQFVSEDVARTIDLMQLLHGDTHRLGHSLDTAGQRIVLRRVEGVIAILLEAEFGEG